MIYGRIPKLTDTLKSNLVKGAYASLIDLDGLGLDLPIDLVIEVGLPIGSHEIQITITGREPDTDTELLDFGSHKVMFGGTVRLIDITWPVRIE
jgi:hypothetical protein